MSEKVAELIGTLERPERKKRADVSVLLLELLPVLSQVIQEAEDMRLKGQLAEIDEDDPEIHARMNLFVNAGGAITRYCRDIETNARDLISAFRTLEQHHAEVKAIVASKNGGALQEVESLESGKAVVDPGAP